MPAGEDASTIGVGLTGATVVVTVWYVGVWYAAAIDSLEAWSVSVKVVGVDSIADAGLICTV